MMKFQEAKWYSAFGCLESRPLEAKAQLLSQKSSVKILFCKILCEGSLGFSRSLEYHRVIWSNLLKSTEKRRLFNRFSLERFSEFSHSFDHQWRGFNEETEMRSLQWRVFNEEIAMKRIVLTIVLNFRIWRRLIQVFVLTQNLTHTLTEMRTSAMSRSHQEDNRNDRRPCNRLLPLALLLSCSYSITTHPLSSRIYAVYF